VSLPLSLTQSYFHDIILAEGFDPSWQHVATTIETEREFDAGRVAEASAALEARHPLLATRLAYRDDEPRLHDAAGGTSAAVVLDLRDCSSDEFEIHLSRAVEQPFDLLDGPLWRVVVARGPAGRNALSFVCHHLVGDIISTWILLKDFGLQYFGGELDPPTEPYAAFTAHQHALRDDPPAADIAFWDQYLDGAQPLLETAERPAVGELAAGAVVPLPFDPVDGGVLLAKARRTRVTPLSLLIAMTMSGLRQATGQLDLVCGVVTDARGSRFARTVGTFSELMFLRERDGEADERTRLTALRNAFFAGWRHHLPVALLRERVACFRESGRAALNPCDAFLNFFPIATSSDWLALTASYEDPTLNFHRLRHRSPSPARRMLGPLFFFSYMHERHLYGSVAVRRGGALAPLNGAVVDAVAREFSELAREPVASAEAA
jgi:hypothetical protein